MKRIAYLVSGGDAPGIDACLFGITAAARHHGIQCLAVPYGLEGLIDGRFQETESMWPGMVNYGGSAVPTGRSARFREKHWQARAVEQARGAGIEGLVILGGDGSAQAARALADLDLPCVCVPVTVDNDIEPTDYSLGFNSAVQQVRDMLMGLQGTARTYRGRVHLLETLGGPTGHLALAGGLAGGADLLLLPELHPTAAQVAARVTSILGQGKEWLVICACEGLLESWQPGKQGVVLAYAREVERVAGVQARVSVMGHFVRGSAPTAFDSVLGQMMGAQAVALLLEGRANRMVVFREGHLASVDLGAVRKRRELNADHMALASVRGCLLG